MDDYIWRQQMESARLSVREFNHWMRTKHPECSLASNDNGELVDAEAIRYWDCWIASWEKRGELEAQIEDAGN